MTSARDTRGAVAMWITPADAAVMTGFVEKTIYRAMNGGELTASKVRGRWLIDPRDVVGWVESFRFDAAAEFSVELRRIRPGIPETGSLAELRAIEREAT